MVVRSQNEENIFWQNLGSLTLLGRRRRTRSPTSTFMTPGPTVSTMPMNWKGKEGEGAQSASAIGLHKEVFLFRSPYNTEKE